MAQFLKLLQRFFSDCLCSWNYSKRLFFGLIGLIGPILKIIPNFFGGVIGPVFEIIPNGFFGLIGLIWPNSWNYSKLFFWGGGWLAQFLKLFQRVFFFLLSTDPGYDNRTIASTLKMHIWIATNNRDVPRVMKTKFPATVIIFGMVSSEGHIMPPHIFEVCLKVNTKVYLDVLKSVVNPWRNQVAAGRPWVWQQNTTPAHKSRDPGWASEGVIWLCILLLLPPFSPDLNPLD